MYTCRGCFDDSLIDKQQLFYGGSIFFGKLLIHWENIGFGMGVEWKTVMK
jgi:hypothetical protein